MNIRCYFFSNPSYHVTFGLSQYQLSDEMSIHFSDHGLLFIYLASGIVVFCLANMQKCILCWECSDKSFKLSGPEGIQFDAEFILRKYFDFCFEVSMADAVSAA